MNGYYIRGYGFGSRECLMNVQCTSYMKGVNVATSYNTTLQRAQNNLSIKKYVCEHFQRFSEKFGKG